MRAALGWMGVLALLAAIAGCSEQPPSAPKEQRPAGEAKPEAKPPAAQQTEEAEPKPEEPPDPFQERIEQAGQIADLAERVAALLEIAKEQAAVGEKGAAQKTFEMAAEECVRFGSPDQRVGLLLEVARARHQAGDTEGAQAVLADALAAADKAKPGERIPLMAEVAQARAELGDAPGAEETLQGAAKLVEAVKKDEDKIRALGAIAGAYHAMDETAEAERTIGAALHRATGIFDNRLRCEAMAEVAVQQMPIDPEAAGRKFDLSLTIAGDIEDSFDRARTLAKIAEKLSRAGHHARAHDILKQAEEAAGEISEEDYRERTLERIRRLKEKLPQPKKPEGPAKQ